MFFISWQRHVVRRGAVFLLTSAKWYRTMVLHIPLAQMERKRLLRRAGGGSILAKWVKITIFTPLFG